MIHHLISISVQCFSSLLKIHRFEKQILSIYLAQCITLNPSRENLTVNYYYHSDVCEDFKV